MGDRIFRVTSDLIGESVRLPDTIRPSFWGHVMFTSHPIDFCNECHDNCFSIVCMVTLQEEVVFQVVRDEVGFIRNGGNKNHNSLTDVHICDGI